jgi:hypothetical protein
MCRERKDAEVPLIAYAHRLAEKARQRRLAARADEAVVHAADADDGAEFPELKEVRQSCNQRLKSRIRSSSVQACCRVVIRLNTSGIRELGFASTVKYRRLAR